MPSSKTGENAPNQKQSDPRAMAREIRRLVLRESKRANVGHIGSALSIADILAALYGGVLKTVNDPHADRDRLILSKGHAALAQYAALHLSNLLTNEELSTYCGDDTLLGVHPEHALKGVDFCTGSLGHGLSIGAGAALAARMQNSSRKVYVVLSDAECNEGSVWEAIMFAAHHKLANLVAIVDLNGQQAFGYTRDVLEPSPMIDRWKAFGWNAHDVDGHDVDAMQRIMREIPEQGAPNVLIARTTFGKGVSYMHNTIKWHYWPMSDAEYAQALQEIDA
jgi:transketolase